VRHKSTNSDRIVYLKRRITLNWKIKVSKKGQNISLISWQNRKSPIQRKKRNNNHHNHNLNLELKNERRRRRRSRKP
jgi:hypothetical protein